MILNDSWNMVLKMSDFRKKNEILNKNIVKAVLTLRVQLVSRVFYD